MFTVDPTSLLFQNLDDRSAAELHALCAGIVNEGKLPVWDTDPYWVAWFKAAGLDERQRLLVLSTVFPGKGLTSVADFYRARHTTSVTLVREATPSDQKLARLVKKYDAKMAKHLQGKENSQFDGAWGYAQQQAMDAVE